MRGALAGRADVGAYRDWGPEGIGPNYRLEWPYAAHRPRPANRARGERFNFADTRSDMTDGRHSTELYQIAQEGMRSGLYLPNRASFLCSRKYRSFWSRYAEEYG